MAGLYVHIPFCHAKCSYCDFFSTPNQKYISQYVSALINELHLRKNEIKEPYTSLYIGGGTPSLIPQNDIIRLIDALKTPEMQEITLEANPEDVSNSWAEFIAKTGVNRISMGFQSFVDSELKIVSRRHTATTSINAINALRKAGINELSGDLIYGLPSQTIESWNYSLKKLLSYELPHISAYSLSYEPGTRLYAQLLSGKIKEIEEDIIVEMYNILINKMSDANYEHYEISNFAKIGHRSQHNSNYWHNIPYLGLGVSAHSFDGKSRKANSTNIADYIKSINSGSIYYEIENENIYELYNDFVITALRTREGIDLDEMSKKYNVNRLLSDAYKYIQSGELVHTKQRLFFDEKAWLKSDGILRDLIII